VLFDQKYSDADKSLVRAANPDFFLVDLRLRHGRPLFGYYFDAGEDADLHASPPLDVDLVKFDDSPDVGRVYDNGYEIIYDVRNLIDEEPRNILATSNNDARIKSAEWVGRTFRTGGRLGYQAALPGPAAPEDLDHPGSALTRRIQSGAVTGSVGDRAQLNYDEGVLRHVAK
jgi:hypothetical protein